MRNKPELSGKRIVIYPNDIITMTGCTERTAQRYLVQIRKAVGKKPRSHVTISDFCLFMSFDEWEVIQALS